MKILFLAPYPLGESPSQRFRFEQYLDVLEQEHSWNFYSFYSPSTWRILYNPGNAGKKAKGIANGFFRRFLLLFTLSKYDIVFIHREAAPVGPPIFEWIIGRVLNKRIIYDFDDAIWLPNTSASNRIAKSLKFHSKVKSIVSYSAAISCGNDFLASYSRRFNSTVVINPTTIDLSYHVPKNQSNRIPIIGWTGTHSTLKYLEPIIEILNQVYTTHKFQLKIICDAAPTFHFPELIHCPWTLDMEIEDLNNIDIGLMPLENDDWARGKCGFKALQYMALKIPALVSPVGINKEIVDHGTNGFHCHELKDWKKEIIKLIEDVPLRKEIGENGRSKVEQRFSTKSNQANFLALFE